MANVQQGSNSVDFRNPSIQIAEEEATYLCDRYFGRWIVAVYEFCKSIKQKIINWQVSKTYKKLLHEYNISDILVAVRGRKGHP